MAEKEIEEVKSTTQVEPTKPAEKKKTKKFPKLLPKGHHEEEKKLKFRIADPITSQESFTSALGDEAEGSQIQLDKVESPALTVLKKFVLTPLKHSQPRSASQTGCISKTDATLIEMERPIFISLVSSSNQLFEILKHSPSGSEADLNLITSTYLRKLEGVKKAIRNGADVNTCRDRQTPLLIATEMGDIRLVRYLLNVPNVNPNFRNVFGETPLIIAVRNGFNQIVRHLLNNNADVNISDNLGKTPLHECLFQKRYNLAKVLLAFGANCEQPDCFGERPMYTTAVKKPNMECLLVLLKVGASPEYFNMTGISLLSRAIMNWTEFLIIETLVRYGAAINSQDCITEKTPLHFAAIINDLKIVKFLISKGADPNIRTTYNYTAYDEAIFHKNVEVAEFLMNLTENANVKAFRALKFNI